MSKRVIRKIPTSPGTLTEGQNVARVRFDLTEWQDVADNQVLGMTTASGRIQFEKADEASSFLNSRKIALLRGGGIEVEIILRSINSFEIAGSITDVP
jgi:hypothetical protein